jgi:hypothetical protein
MKVKKKPEEEGKGEQKKKETNEVNRGVKSTTKREPLARKSAEKIKLDEVVEAVVRMKAGLPDVLGHMA